VLYLIDLLIIFIDFEYCSYAIILMMIFIISKY